MINNIKKMNITEFREKGYLQEINRRFLHPLGLALETSIVEYNEYISGVWDYRDDEEGIYYDIADSDPERIKTFKEKKLFIDNEFERRFQYRKKTLGFDIEPVD